MAYDTPITSSVSTPQPSPPPNNPPSDWSNVVHANYFSNIERLGRWTGKTTQLTPNSDPSGYFSPVTVSSLGAVDLGVVPSPIYVLVHGWAPGYVNQVPPDGDLFWWSSGAAVTVDGNPVWPSSWAWAGLTIGAEGDNPFCVNSTGVLQSIAQMNPNATLLCYSWLDDSATVDSDDPQDYQSEANTHINGIRLANALQEAINLSFFLNGGSLHLIGHSHGSKVCTVAALRLQQAGFPAARLTLLDSPEYGAGGDDDGEPGPLDDNGANLLGAYLQGLNIMDPSNPEAGGTFVENYASYFGVMLGQNPSRIIGVCLNPDGTGSSPDITDSHSYAAGWYGASASSSVGLAWTTPPTVYSSAAPVLLQGSSSSTDSQFNLSPGTSTSLGFSTYDYNLQPLTDTDGNTISVTVDAQNPYIATSWFYTDNTDQYGIAFDVNWASPQVGDYLVVSVTPYLTVDDTYSLLVIDGQSAPPAQTTVFINLEVDVSDSAYLAVYFVAAAGSPDDDQVSLSNFQWISVADAPST